MLAPPRTGVGVGEWLLRATVGTALRRRGKGGGGRGHLRASYAEAPAAPPHAWGQQPPLVEPAGVSGCSDAIRQKNCSKVPPAAGWRPAPPGFHPRSNWAAAGPPSRMFCLVGSFAFFARYRRARYVGPFTCFRRSGRLCARSSLNSRLPGDKGAHSENGCHPGLGRPGPFLARVAGHAAPDPSASQTASRRHVARAGRAPVLPARRVNIEGAPNALRAV